MLLGPTGKIDIRWSYGESIELEVHVHGKKALFYGDNIEALCAEAVTTTLGIPTG
jgi:hypothetical protein